MLPFPLAVPGQFVSLLKNTSHELNSLKIEWGAAMPPNGEVTYEVGHSHSLSPC